MDCEGFDEELIPYVLGVAGDGTRGEMDEHLLGCASCLRHFLETKHHIERSEGGPRPSPAVKERLRAQLFPRPAGGVRLFRSLAKPVPLYQALAAALAVAALAALAPRIVEGQAARTRTVTRVDTSRKVPEAAAIY